MKAEYGEADDSIQYDGISDPAVTIDSYTVLPTD